MPLLLEQTLQSVTILSLSLRPFKLRLKNGNMYAVRGGAVKKQVGRVEYYRDRGGVGSDRIGRAAEGNEERERSSLAKLDNRADDPAVAEREWRMGMKRDRRGQNGNNAAARYYFLFAASDQPTTHSEPPVFHPPLIYPPVFRSGAAITSASLCDAH